MSGGLTLVTSEIGWTERRVDAMPSRLSPFPPRSTGSESPTSCLTPLATCRHTRLLREGITVTAGPIQGERITLAGLTAPEIEKTTEFLEIVYPADRITLRFLPEGQPQTLDFLARHRSFAA